MRPLSWLVDSWDPEYGRSEMVREGFPDKTPAEFCELYIAHNGGDLDTLRNRIEFEHECPLCEGTGRVHILGVYDDWTDDECPRCHGEGWIPRGGTE